MGVLNFKSVSGGEKEISPTPSHDDQHASPFQQDWTAEEEKRAKRKLDMIIMPLLTLGFFCLRRILRPTFQICRFFRLTADRARSR